MNFSEAMFYENYLTSDFHTRQNGVENRDKAYCFPSGFTRLNFEDSKKYFFSYTWTLLRIHVIIVTWMLDSWTWSYEIVSVTLQRS